MPPSPLSNGTSPALCVSVDALTAGLLEGAGHRQLAAWKALPADSITHICRLCRGGGDMAVTLTAVVSCVVACGRSCRLSRPRARGGGVDGGQTTCPGVPWEGIGGTSAPREPSASAVAHCTPLACTSAVVARTSLFWRGGCTYIDNGDSGYTSAPTCAVGVLRLGGYGLSCKRSDKGRMRAL